MGMTYIYILNVDHEKKSEEEAEEKS